MPRPATQSIAFGTVRWYFELEACLALLLDRPDSRMDPEVRALILVGLYQLQHGATPEHAAVSETVEAARALGRPRTAGLVNALLRRFQREREAIVRNAHRRAGRAPCSSGVDARPFRTRMAGAVGSRSPPPGTPSRRCGCE